MVAPLVGAAAISAASSAFGSLWSKAEARRAAQRQRRWEIERATHAHQWEMEDLQAAGLNPILTAGGSGATTGGISAPVPETSGFEQIGNAIFSALQMANDTKRLENETQETGANINLKAAEAQKTAAETITEAYKQGLLTEQQANTAMDTMVKEKSIEQMENQINLSRKQYELAVKQYENEKKELGVKIYQAQKEGRKAEAEALSQEMRNKDYQFYKWRDTIFETWDRMNNTVDSWRNRNPKNHEKKKLNKKELGKWARTAAIVGTRML